MKKSAPGLQGLVTTGADAGAGEEGHTLRPPIPDDVIKAAALGVPDSDWRDARCGTLADVSHDAQIIDACIAAGAPNLAAWCVFADMSPPQIMKLVREYAA